MTADQLAALLPVLSISKQTGSDLEKAAQQEALVAVWMPDYSSFDFNVVLLWNIAVGTFVAAGLWAASDSCGSESGFLNTDRSAEVSDYLIADG